MKRNLCHVSILMNLWEKIAHLQREGTDAVVITIASARGSVPGVVGGKAIVTAAGLIAGNLGGGKIEAKAISHAEDLLHGKAADGYHLWNLQRDVGMTCGGEMGLLFEKVTAHMPWRIAIFGAGHVSQALVPVLATLACRLEVFDVRAEWLEKFAMYENVSFHQVSSFEDGVERINEESFVLAITQGHTTDRPVLREVLRRLPQVPFIGVIGSASKRAVLLRELCDDGIPQDLLEKIVCPLGLAFGGNDPAEIAISIAAQLLTRRETIEMEASKLHGSFQDFR